MARTNWDSIIEKLSADKKYKKSYILCFEVIKAMDQRCANGNFYYHTFEGLTDFKIQKGVFSPALAKDSIFWPIHLVKNAYTQDKKILEMGTGTGITSIYVARYGNPKKVVAVDINNLAIENSIDNRTKYGIDANRLEIKESNLFEKIDEKFDIILWSFPWIFVDKNQKEEIDAMTDILTYEQKKLLGNTFSGIT